MTLSKPQYSRETNTFSILSVIYIALNLFTVSCATVVTKYKPATHFFNCLLFVLYYFTYVVNQKYIRIYKIRFCLNFPLMIVLLTYMHNARVVHKRNFNELWLNLYMSVSNARGRGFVRDNWYTGFNKIAFLFLYTHDKAIGCLKLTYALQRWNGFFRW